MRMVYFVELSCSVMIGCAAGWRPLEGSCVGVAAFMLGASALLLCYSVWQHPYDGRLDQSFSVSNSLLLALQAGCSVAHCCGGERLCSERARLRDTHDNLCASFCSPLWPLLGTARWRHVGGSRLLRVC